MKNLSRSIIFLSLFCLLSAGGALAQAPKKAPDYKIKNIKIVPFNSSSGEFEAELTPKDERSFFNALEIGLFVTVEISGTADSFETGRKVQVTVMEGKKVKLTRLEQIGYMGENATFFFPVWLAPAMCSDVTITASLAGQKTPSKMSRKVPFLCGE